MQFTIINSPTKENQNCGDVVSRYENDVSLTGGGYENYTVVKAISVDLNDSDFLVGANLSGLTIFDINNLLTLNEADSIALLQSKI